ncbi:MAG: hypothetical protein WBC33_01565, partial [Conexibacter sp.]
MRSGAAVRHQLLCSVVAVLAVVAFSGVAHADARRLQLLGGDDARQVKLAAPAADGSRKGTVAILVRNETGVRGTVQATLVLAGGTVVPANGETAIGGVRLSVPTSELGPGSSGPVVVTLQLDKDVELAGTLLLAILEAAGARDAAVQLAEPKAEEPPKPALEPSSVQLVQVHHCPLAGVPLLEAACGEHLSAPLWLRDGKVSDALGTRPEALAASDSGGSAVMWLDNDPNAWGDRDGLPDPPTGTSLLRAHAKGSKAGDYSADVLLDPAQADGAKVTVKLRVRTWVGWMVLIVALGAVLGLVVRELLPLGIRRLTLKLSLRRTYAIYAAAVPGRVAAMYDLDDWFGNIRDGVPELPDAGGCTEDLDGFLELWCKALRGDREDDLDTLEQQAQAVAGAVARWVDVNNAARRLQRTFAALPPARVQEREPLHEEIVALLGTGGIPPVGDEAGASKAIAALNGEADVLYEYEQAMHAWDGLSDADKATHAAADPRKAFKDAKGTADKGPLE